MSLNVIWDGLSVQGAAIVLQGLLVAVLVAVSVPVRIVTSIALVRVAVRLWMLSSLLWWSLSIRLPFILLAIGFTLGRRAVSRLRGFVIWR